MTAALLLGALLGAGLWSLAWGLREPSIDAASTTAARNGRSLEASTDGRSRPGLALRVSNRVDGLLEIDHRRDLEVTRTPAEEHATNRLKSAAAGFVISVVLAGALTNLTDPWTPAIAGAIGGTLFFFIPDLALRSEAEKARRQFSAALTRYVGLVAIAVSGGANVRTALVDVATIGRGWIFDALQLAIRRSRNNNQPPWVGFRHLAEEWKINELVDLANALALASATGSPIEDALHDRADAARSREQAEARADAETRSEKMSAPVAFLMLGWVGFMGYPAMMKLVSL